MGTYWENATMEIRERVGDPLLRVEYEDGTKEPYVVLKWFRSFQDFEEQMRFPIWDPALAEKVLLAGRPGLYNPKSFKYNRRVMREKLSVMRASAFRDFGKALGGDLWQTTPHATIYSTPERTG